MHFIQGILQNADKKRKVCGCSTLPQKIYYLEGRERKKARGLNPRSSLLFDKTDDQSLTYVRTREPSVEVNELGCLIKV